MVRPNFPSGLAAQMLEGCGWLSADVELRRRAQTGGGYGFYALQPRLGLNICSVK